MDALPSLPRLRDLLWIITGFFVLGLLIYAGSLHDAFVRWDDGMLIYENPAIRAINPSSIKWIFTHFDPELYIPLTFFTYQVEFAISGTQPFLYHLDNLVLHTLNALLVAWFLYLLIQRKWIAVALGLLFLVHPLNTEAVEWASARKDVLSTFFFLGSMIAYLYYQQRVMVSVDEPYTRGPSSPLGVTHKKYLALSVVLFLLGLLSKVMVITLPVVLVLIDWLQSRPINRKMFTDKIAYLALAIILGLVGILGKQSIIASTTLWQKVLMGCKSISFYLHQFFWPAKLSLLYPYTKTITLASPDFFIPVIVVLILLVLIIVSRNRFRFVSVGLLFYVITVAPTLLNFSKGDLDLYFASDRYAYVPQIGLLFIIGVLVAIATDRQTIKGVTRYAPTAIGCVLIAVLSVMAYRQSLVWADTRSLFEHVIEVYPDASYVAYNNLGNMYRLQNDLPSAIAQYRKAIAIKPHPRTYSNLGAAYRKQKDIPDALEAYKKALQLDPKSPDAHFGLGIVYADEGQFSDALAEYNTALTLNPTRPQDIYTDLGALAAVQNDFQGAVTEYQKALAIDPYNPPTVYNMAVAEDSLGQTQQAMKDYANAIALDPKMIAARINLALLEYNSGDTASAIAQFRTVLLLDPTNASAHSALKQLGQE
jgi:tetratricopeptide (TPR) repeat protein